MTNGKDRIFISLPKRKQQLRFNLNKMESETEKATK